MAKIRKLYDEAIKPDGSKQVIYPITSTRAVYTPSNITIDAVLNEGYRFGGVVKPKDSPAFLDQRVFYAASVPGIYNNFGEIAVHGGEAAFLLYDGTSWSKGLFSGAGSSNLSGFVVLDSISELPREKTTLGYLIEDESVPEGLANEFLYVWVGENGDTLDGLYQNCGQLRGASAYEIAVMNGYEGTEEEWLNDPVDGIKGISVQSFEVIGDYDPSESAVNNYKVTLTNGEYFIIPIKNGTGISSIEADSISYMNGGISTYKITLSDGRDYTFQVRNGKTSTGLFSTVETLTEAQPNPEVGDYAFVGAAFPAELYVCTEAGVWSDSGETYDGDNVDLTDYALKEDVGYYIDNPEYVRVYTDSEQRILWGIKTDGSIYYGVGIPPQVKEYVDSEIQKTTPENYQQVLDFLDGLYTSDKTLQQLLTEIDGKIATETERAITAENEINERLDYLNIAIDPRRGVLRIGTYMFKLTSYEGPADFDEDIDYTVFVDAVTTIENPEWQEAITDSEDKILYGMHHDGSEYQPDLSGYTMTVDGVTASVNSIINNLK